MGLKIQCRESNRSNQAQSQVLFKNKWIFRDFWQHIYRRWTMDG
jgi:hypothetical protein